MATYNRNADYSVHGNNYQRNNNVAIPKGANKSLLTSGEFTDSIINKLHLIKLANNYPYKETELAKNRELFNPLTFEDLCKMESRGALQYDVDDFYYLKNLGFPINRLITLRRFPYPCTDNIWDKETQGEPDIARMVTYFDQEVNKMEELLSFSYKMNWRELKAEYEQASMQGEQSGLSGFMKKAFMAFDPNLYNNNLMGKNAMDLNPKFDENKVYGPVDSITRTHIRDVGLEWTQYLELQFDYELRSWKGRTPEYAMKDIMANILACTYNNGKFWPGARYWIGERPSQFYQRYQYLNGTDMDKMLNQSFADLKSAINMFSTKSSAIDTLKQAMKGGMALALGKILDKVGRPGILTMNSLLSGEPTGFWHVTIGNPLNPIMCMGNLIIDGTDWSFPTDSLSYGDMPTKLRVKVKLKPAQDRDRAGAEIMLNGGRHRIYYAPKTVSRQETHDVKRTARSFFGHDEKEVNNMLSQAYDFIADGVKLTSSTLKDDKKLDKSGLSGDISSIAKNANSARNNAEKTS